jgi:hypothetical protein
MDFVETLEVVIPIVATLFGGGLLKRDRVAAGIGLVAGGVIAAVIFVLLGNARPLVGLIALMGIVGGIVADERGKRPIGLAGFAVGFFALLIAYFYT